MKANILSLLALLVTTTVHADDLSLYLEPNVGEVASYEVRTLQAMTFEGGNVVLTRKDGTAVTTAISSLRRMYFDQTATAVNALLGTIPASYTLYDINGVVVGQGIAASAADIVTATLAHGVYIVSIKGQNFKILK